MELFGSTTSPFVRHCRIALEQTHQKYTFSLVDYAQTAKKSPVQKMPYLVDGEHVFTDSASILMYVRQLTKAPFPADPQDFELFTMASTLIDTAVNIFLLEKDTITSKESQYLARQESRLATGFKALNNTVQPAKALTTDGHMRAACLVDWTLFRQRYDLSSYTQLKELLQQANSDPFFTKTDPRGSLKQ